MFCVPCEEIEAAQSSVGEGAKLTDFGVAHFATAGARGMVAAEWHTKGFAGTPVYMAPEQAQGYVGAFGPWTDLYALGVILFEIISGAPPFKGHADATVLMQHLHEPLPALTYREGVEPLPGIEGLLKRLLDKNLWARPRFAAKVREEFLGLWPGGGREKGDGKKGAAKGSKGAESVRVRALQLRDPPLVGRDVLLESLREAARGVLGATAQTTLQVVLIEGPAGIGKSRLAEALLQYLEEAGMMQAWYGSYRRDDQRDDAPLGVVAAIERYYHCSGLDRLQVEQTLSRRLGQPGALDPQDLRLLLDFLRPIQGPLEDDAWGELAARAIQRASQQIPVVLWLDDLQHDLEGPTLGLIQRLLSGDVFDAVSPSPCLVVLTMRALDRDADPTGRLRHRLHTACHHVQVRRVDLAPLNDAALLSLLHDTLSLPGPLCRHIVRKAQGNPFVALQHARAALELSGGALPSTPSATPRAEGTQSAPERELHRELNDDQPPLVISPLTSQRLLADTLRRLLEQHPSPDGQIALGMVALMAPQISTHTLLTALRAGWPDMPWDMTLPPLLADALHAGLFAQAPAAPAPESDPTAPAPPPTASLSAPPSSAALPPDGATVERLFSLYEPLNRLLIDHLARHGWTRRAHMAAAQALDLIHGDNAPCAILSARARHLARAHNQRDAWTLLKRLLREELLYGHFSQVISLCHEARRWLEDWQDPPDSPRRVRLMRALALCAIACGDLAGAARLLDEEPLADSPTSPTASAHRRWLYAEYYLESRDYDAAEAAFLSSLDTFRRSTTPPLTQGFAQIGLAKLYRLCNRFDDAKAAAASAFDFFSTTFHHPIGQAASLHALGQIEAITENFSAGMHYYQQALSLLADLPPSHTLASVHQSIAGCRLAQRLFSDAETHLQHAREGYERCGDQRGLALNLRAQARLSRDLGHHPAAIQHLERAILIFDQINNLLSSADCHIDLAGILRKINRYDAAQQHIQTAMRLYRTLNYDRGRANSLILLGNLLLDMGNSQQAMSRLEAAQSLARDLDEPRLLLLSTINLGRTLMDIGQIPAAHRQLENAQTLAEHLQDPVILAVALAYDMLVLSPATNPPPPPTTAPATTASAPPPAQKTDFPRLAALLARIQTCLPDGISLELGTALEQLAENLTRSPPKLLDPDAVNIARQALKISLLCVESMQQTHLIRRINQKLSGLPKPPKGTPPAPPPVLPPG